MRTLISLARPLAAPSKILLRTYSSQSPSLIKINDIPAPNSGRIRIISLSRPEARNAISRQLLQELGDAVRSINAEYRWTNNKRTDGSVEVPLKQRFGGAAGEDVKGHTRAVIIASEVDSCFCAGADLKERRGMSEDETQDFLKKLRTTFAQLAKLPIPTISAISSLALGGGLELGLSTTFRVLASTAEVGLPETRLGIIPGAGGTYRLHTLVGLSRARDLILTGRRVSAAEAYFLGIANRLVEVVPEEGETKEELMKRAGDEVLKQAVKLAGDICEGAPTAVRCALVAIGQKRPSLEDEMYDVVVKTEDRNEALKAFAEKRKPVFTGH